MTEILGVSAYSATALLQKFQWSKENLLEAYMNDSDKVLKLAGVYHRCGNTIPPKSITECPICYDEPDDLLSMPCGHSFCHGCWREFCENAVAEGPSAVRKTCPQAGCPEAITEEEMSAALGSSSPLLRKYQLYQLRSFVDSNSLTRWCPGPGCDRVACALNASAMEAEGNVARCDSCQTSFCLVCGNEPHRPASCRDLTCWMEKCRNESETANWILANTKECPKCVARIEKNNGCTCNASNKHGKFFKKLHNFYGWICFASLTQPCLFVLLWFSFSVTTMCVDALVLYLSPQPSFL